MSKKVYCKNCKHLKSKLWVSLRNMPYLKCKIKINRIKNNFYECIAIKEYSYCGIKNKLNDCSDFENKI